MAARHGVDPCIAHETGSITAANWIDLEVRADCSDAELEKIRRLAKKLTHGAALSVASTYWHPRVAIRDAEHDIERSMRRIDEIGQDLQRFDRGRGLLNGCWRRALRTSRLSINDLAGAYRSQAGDRIAGHNDAARGDRKLEHVLDSFEKKQQRARHCLTDAERRFASYRSREGGTFGFAGDLAEKRLQLAKIEKSLAADVTA